jgi:long-chain acyl-CoA synthetase
VKARLGGRLRLAISGGAPLSKDIAEFFHALDILIVEGYGLSECTTAATVNHPDRYRFGSVGLAFPDTEVRIADDGEVLIRGEHVFAGYFGDDDATREVVGEDGWLRSGDIGTIDGDGFLFITDRKKDMIVTAGGKNVAPQYVENELKASRYVSQALVVGDRRPFIVALVTLEETEILKWAEANGAVGDIAALAADERVRTLVAAELERVNVDLARFEQIKRFAILPRDFTQEDGEITPTLKLRRRVCEQHFAAQIEALYRT